jgi:hypothetical protein
MNFDQMREKNSRIPGCDAPRRPTRSSHTYREISAK